MAIDLTQTQFQSLIDIDMTFECKRIGCHLQACGIQTLVCLQSLSEDWHADARDCFSWRGGTVETDLFLDMRLGRDSINDTWYW